jgi:hypothetical protein
MKYFQVCVPKTSLDIFLFYYVIIMKSHKKNTKITKTKKTTKTTKRKKLQKKGGSVPSNPSWRVGFTTLVRLLDIDGTPLEIYGTSLPINEPSHLTNTLLYYMYKKQIRRIMSFQGCSDPMCPPINKQYCPQPNVFLEDKTWDVIKYSIPSAPKKNNSEFIPVINNLVQDLTAGNLSSWLLFSKYNVDIESERLILHCYAGFGRTGSALLYFLLTRRVSQFRDFFLQKWWGLGGSKEMVSFMRGLLRNNIRLELDTDPSINSKIQAFDINIISQEVFRIDNLYYGNLFVTRVNYIILMLAYRNNIPIDTPIYLYKVPSSYMLMNSSLDDDDILFYPTLFIFKGWDNVNTMLSLQNQFGITTIIPPVPAPAHAPTHATAHGTAPTQSDSFGFFRMPSSSK